MSTHDENVALLAQFLREIRNEAGKPFVKPDVAQEAAEKIIFEMSEDWGCESCGACYQREIDRQEAAGVTDAWIKYPRLLIVCSECGNKRCPKAANHDQDCTGSNEPGQPGSMYPAIDRSAPRPTTEELMKRLEGLK